MDHFPPQQLSLDFDVSQETVRPELRLSAEKSCVLTTPRQLTSPRSPQVEDESSVVSLCEFRGVKAQQKTSQIYRSILSSVSHIS